MKSFFINIFFVIILISGNVYSDDIPVGHLVDFTGATSSVGKPFGQGVADAITYINKQGGVSGNIIHSDMVDYSYQAPRAVATYKRWRSRLKVVAVQGWGTADTEALIGTVARDEVPYFSASYAGQLTDPTGKAPKAIKAAPYNFFYGPSYSDACRALVSWAAENWEKKGTNEKPKYVHMGDNHPYPNAPKEACEEYALELGFEVLPVINYTLAPGDFTAQCLTLKQVKADYAFLANSSGSTISLLNACSTVGVKAQFMTNVWGIDEPVIKAAGKAADGTVFAVRTGIVWGGDALGMKTLRSISRESGNEETYRSVHYLAGICSVFYMKEAMDIALNKGMLTGENIKNAMYIKKDWVPKGLEGVCLPSSWTSEDHRGLMTVPIYRVKVNGITAGKELKTLMENNVIQLLKEKEITLPRRAEWRGY